ncbi:MAG: hypothetical protein A4E73_03352 [Syntrophaceae bacterium PtaU1.Bin231]|nr:MAG: hypothetical protein A4E73_03352 [Syntrophaceae bacterium PtaU1.Bin231]
MFIGEVDDAERKAELAGRGARTLRAEEGGFERNGQDFDPLFEDDLGGEEAVEPPGKQGKRFHVQ